MMMGLLMALTLSEGISMFKSTPLDARLRSSARHAMVGFKAAESERQESRGIYPSLRRLHEM